MKYRKKPVVIEAFKYSANTDETVVIPVWFIHACRDGVVFAKGKKDCIKTLEGDMEINDGDYVIKGIKGELYPCKPDIFEASYERV